MQKTKRELFMRLDAVAAESDQMPTELSALRSARDRVDALMRSIADQSVRALDAFFN